MKKIYSKPDIYFDNFSMSTAIAGNCSTVTDTYAGGQCGLEYTDTIIIFANDVSQCNFKVGDSSIDAEWNGICYHVPSGNISNKPGEGGLFNS